MLGHRRLRKPTHHNGVADAEWDGSQRHDMVIPVTIVAGIRELQARDNRTDRRDHGCRPDSPTTGLHAAEIGTDLHRLVVVRRDDATRDVGTDRHRIPSFLIRGRPRKAGQHGPPLEVVMTG